MSCLCEKLGAGIPGLSPACIGQLWLFKNLKPPELEALVSRALRQRFSRGEFIFTQGQPADRMFLIKGGRVRLAKVTEQGDEITLDLRKAGDSLGENLLNEDEIFPMSAVCLEDTLTCGFNKSQFEALVLDFPNIGLQVIKNLSHRIDWLTSRVGSMSFTNLEERLYRVLVNVAREHGDAGPDGLVLSMPLTHEDISFLVGAHRVSVTRAMKGLRASGLVSTQGRKLILKEQPVN